MPIVCDFGSLLAQHAHATDRCAHEIMAILTSLPALAAADAQDVRPTKGD